MEQKNIIKNWSDALEMSEKLDLKLTMNINFSDGVFRLQKSTKLSEFSFKEKTVYESNDICTIVSFLKGIEYVNVL